MTSLPAWLRESPKGCSLAVRVQPKAGRDRLVKVEEGHLKIQLKAPAEDGKANAALLRFLQDFFKIQRANIKILLGEKSRSKWVEISGLSAAEASAAVWSHHKS
ncbi:MAG TPA: DUF167 domain-containing protein [bacterium]|nr:DUF167 domain-containing protein [bacterium]